MKTSRWLILAISSIALLLCLLAVTATGQAGSRIAPEGQTLGVPSDDQGDSVILPEGVSSDWWADAQKDIQRSEYNVTWQDQTYLPDVTAAYQAPNRAHNLRTYFTPAGIRIVPRADATAQWELGLTLTGYGYTGNTQPVAGPELSADAHRMDYRRGNISEWYINEESGLEQGFTIATKPGDPQDGQATELVLEMALSGDLVPSLTEEGQAVEFSSREGIIVLRYSGLQVTDAAGRKLPSRLCLSDSTLSIAVEDSFAVYPIEIDPMLTTPHYNFLIPQASAKVGSSVSTAGDVNGDGYSDVIVGAPYYDGGLTDEGLVIVRYGSATGLAGGSSWLALSGQANARFGDSVDTAGDVNGDGYSDIIAGAPWYDSATYTDAGMAFVWYGSPTGLGETNGSPTNADWKVEGSQASALMGDCVATAGDVNGDGYSDVIIGVRSYDSGDTDEGMAIVYHGSASGLSLTPNWSDQSDQAYAYMGYSVRTAGDVNGDGYSDVIIAAYYWDGGETNEGKVYVYYGSSSGLGSTPWTAEGNQASAYFGISVSTAGDVNGDGYSDVIIGAHYYDGGQTDEGRAYVWYGSSTGLGSAASPNWTAESNQDNAYFGASVSTAGDVNGDGYADVIVGAPNYDDGLVDEGAAFIWYGSSSGLGTNGVPANADWVATGGQAGALFGTAVNIAGDVNGDGYSDVVVGAPSYDFGSYADAGRGCVFLGAAGDPGSTPWTAEGDQANAYFGASVSTAGDVNGDGYSDAIIAALRYDNGQTNEGRAFVYLGSATGLNSSPSWTAESDQASAEFGSSVSSAGDVNGDGYSDVIIGAHLYSNGQDLEGMAFVWYGSASGLGASGTPANADWTAECNMALAYLGYSAGTAGDVNGDGYSDVIIGAWQYGSSPTGEGAAFVWYGSSAGLGANGTPANADWTAESNQDNAYFGESVGTAGDVNGDGYSDVIIGARTYDSGQTNEGMAFVYYGSSSGLGDNGTPPNADWTAESDQASAYLGTSVSTAGDVNGDGYSDVIVGAYYCDSGETDEGMAFVWYGSAAGLGANGNPTNAGWSAESNAENARFGYSVGSAGDVNGDGYSDVIVGAYQYSTGETPEGTAFLWYGSSTGLGSAGTPGNADWSTSGDSLFFGAGCSVGMAGDVNGDGYSDVVVGAPGYANGQSSEGGAFVYYGNGGPGVALRPRQLCYNSSTTPISPLGKSDIATRFRLSLIGRSPFGQGKIKIQCEAKPLGTPLDGTGIKEYPSWQNAGVTFIEFIGELSPSTAYHWRVRLHYQTARTPLQQYSRWVTMPWNGWQEADLRTAPNTPPVAVTDSYSTDEDIALTVVTTSVLVNDTDHDGDPLTAVKVTDPGHGTVTLNSNGTFSYTPAVGYNGSDSFTYHAYDGTDYSNTATVNITVNPVNDAPSFTKGANQTILEDAGAQTVSNWATAISAGPTDESGQTLNFIVTNDNNGLFSVQPAISANGTLTCTPAANVNGSATVTVSIHDNGGTSNGGLDTSPTQTFTITVTAVNDVPSFTKGGNQTVLEDAGLQTVANWATGLSAGPSDESGRVLNFIVSNNNNSLFSVQPAIAANGTLTYTPAANANGSATVTVSIHDNGGIANGGVDTSATQTFTITVTAVNDPPTAVDDAYGVHRDVTLNLSAPGVLTNDSDIDGDSLTAILVSDVSHGTLTLNPNGSFTYTPATDYSGSDSFTYRVYDGTDYSNTATVSITVHAVNHAPEAVGDTYTVAEDAALSVPIGTSVLSNDTDADTDPLKAVVVANVSHGVLVFNDDGSFTYTPAADFAGTDSFTYKVNDGLADSGAATVTITVSPVNDLPVATADAYEAFAGIALSVPAPGLLGNDSDIDGDALTAVLVSNVSHGTLTLNADGSFTYTAESGFAGTDTFTYKATDGTGDSATVTVTIEVTQPEPPTIASVSEPSGRQGGSLTVIITGTKLAGATVLDFGPGVTVNSFKADSPTQITAEITIDSDAVLGTRDILVTTPEGTYTLEGAFTVKKVSSGGTPVWIWPVVALAMIAAGAGGFLLFRRRAKPG